jgi:UDP-2-acetamido-2,6-beta-L-arabino-hexul-4-ose reductase
LAKDLIEIFNKNKSTPNVIFISSIQESLNNTYGNSKIEASKIIKSHCEFKNKLFISLRLPNVFGPFCKPNYNSFIATFCDKISKGNSPEIIKDNKVPLVYVQDVCRVLYDSIIQTQEKSFEEYICNINVSEILNRLNHFNELYNKNGILPKLDNKFNVNLFNTFRSYISPLSQLTRKIDDRGYLIEILKCESSQTQMFYSVTKPGITRGNHFHTRKIERFSVIKGKARIELRRIGTDKIFKFHLDGDKPSFVDIPIWYTHNITNIGNENLYTIFWINDGLVMVLRWNQWFFFAGHAVGLDVFGDIICQNLSSKARELKHLGIYRFCALVFTSSLLV